MPVNPLENAISDAYRANKDLGVLFAKIGNSDHPRGVVPTAYRNARRAMRSALLERNKTAAANEVLTELKTAVRVELSDILATAQARGADHASTQLDLYGVHVGPADPEGLRSQLHNGSAGVLSVIEQQTAAIQSLLALNMDTTLILGDQNRVGVLRPGDVIAAATFWTAALLWAAFSDAVSRKNEAERIKKLVVAAIDSRTTDCCLRAHGQVQPFSKPFILTGTPRYADKLDWTPFHNYCRTSIALIYDEYDYGLTEKMQEKAQAAINRRATHA
jgi:hypothetical protein